LQKSCAVLNEFALPRAIVDFNRHSFVAWNSKFLQQTGFSEDEMKSSKPEELLIFGILICHGRPRSTKNVFAISINVKLSLPSDHP
jgi:hypothetical protein